MQVTAQKEGGTVHFSGTYDPSDVQILLKPAQIAPTPVEEKEALIQSGKRHYSEMLSAEKVPDERYMTLFREALTRNKARLRYDIDLLARMIRARTQTHFKCVLVSLARAGTPIGVLLGRALKRFGVEVHHYSVSIIRDRGIDETAMRHILDRHDARHIVFVDGWTGKGAITRELETSLAKQRLGIEPYLAVVADPAGTAHLAATSEDYVIPSGLLNGIVSGLISRSVLNEDIVGEDDFHACLYMEEHREADLSGAFIEAIDSVVVSKSSQSPWSEDIAAASQLA
ncbi:MAG: cysteine protease StiP domain-containing protein, partial [Pseudomonadota bacterium]|nr:cysteine protease StiP domain-containing protein [Pseudomonadota bacterium]